MALFRDKIIGGVTYRVAKLPPRRWLRAQHLVMKSLAPAVFRSFDSIAGVKAAVGAAIAGKSTSEILEPLDLNLSKLGAAVEGLFVSFSADEQDRLLELLFTDQLAIITRDHLGVEKSTLLPWGSKTGQFEDHFLQRQESLHPLLVHALDVNFRDYFLGLPRLGPLLAALVAGSPSTSPSASSSSGQSTGSSGESA